MDATLTARRVVLHVTIGGHDATDSIKPDLLDFAFTDNATGKADEISLTLADPEGKWSGPWKVKKGQAVTARLECRDWFGPGQHATLPIGSFVVDETSLSGPPDKIQIKAVSASKASAISEEENDRGWENYTLQGLAEEIAGKHGYTLMYDAPTHTFERIDQREESDLSFLHRLCKERGINLKVHDGKMILLAGKTGDAKGPGINIKKSGDQFSPTSYSFKEKSEGTFKNAKVAYRDPAEKETHTADVATDGPPPSGQTLKLNARVESSAAAIAAAEGALREKNKSSDTATMEVMGHPGLVAGITVRLSGFGAYDHNYFVEKAEHTVGSGYKTSVELRKTLGY